MFIEFIKAHYELIVSGLLVLISFIFTLVKKKPVLNKIDEIKVFILTTLTTLINNVEQPGNGPIKKETVIKTLMYLCIKKFNYFSEDLESFTSQAIEDILSTPKKEV